MNRTGKRPTFKFDCRVINDGYCILNKEDRVGKKIYMHRLEVERILGRALGQYEYVHHRDERRWNNCPFNLQLTTPAMHRSQHEMKNQFRLFLTKSIKETVTAQLNVPRDGIARRLFVAS